MFSFSRYFGLAALMLSTGCTSISTTKIADRPITSSFELDGMRWQGSDGIIVVWFDVFDVDGKVAVCGAHSDDNDAPGGTERLNSRGLNAMSIMLDGTPILTDVGALKRINFPSRQKYPKEDATCLLTDRAWDSRYGKSVKPKLIVSQRTFVIRG